MIVHCVKVTRIHVNTVKTIQDGSTRLETGSILMVLNPGVDLVIALDLIVDHGVTVLEAGVDVKLLEEKEEM